MDVSSNLKIVKMSGSGNDFILFDHRTRQFSDAAMIGLTRLLCRRGLSVGADGMIFIEPSERYDFKWRFFNADGSEAEMCGNGGRCAARFAQWIGMAGAEMTFETIAGPIQARVEGRVVKLQLPVPRDIRLDQEIVLGDGRHPVDFINTGVPHTILWVEDDRSAGYFRARSSDSIPSPFSAGRDQREFRPAGGGPYPFPAHL